MNLDSIWMEYSKGLLNYDEAIKKASSEIKKLCSNNPFSNDEKTFECYYCKYQRKIDHLYDSHVTIKDMRRQMCEFCAQDGE